ncbi:MAG: TonB-dependent receptor plug domain-containing protein [Flavobacteriaceae bacterium]
MTINRFFAILISFCSTLKLCAQSDSLSVSQLNEVVVSTNRIALPFSQNERTLQIISGETLRASGVPSVSVALQQIAGIDVRQRGTAGTQADLYIRGGGFDQTLLLVDGIKLDDAQTGHHTLNFLPPIEVIERIEIIKGPTARVFGQNAFTGAINIITKKDFETGGGFNLQSGAFGQLFVRGNYQFAGENTSLLLHAGNNRSSGYRHNTDFKNQEYLLRASLFKKSDLPLQFIASFSDRKFGANGFYASPQAKDQYEETKAQWVALQTQWQKSNWLLRPQLYWRGGEDHYVYIRENPAIYENLHKTNKLGASLNATHHAPWGTTGLGVDIFSTAINSNNLGDRSRMVAAFFVEHRFTLAQERLTLTPGIAINRYSDFGTFSYPGLDLGWQFNSQLLLYANAGYTYRVPTYTDLFYSDFTTEGNADLKPEKAFSRELGFRYQTPSLQAYVAYFNRQATDLIDYIKYDESAKWQANNIQQLTTNGFEAEMQWQFLLENQPQKLILGYTFLNDDLAQDLTPFSRYSINSLKHHLTATYQAQLNAQWHFFTAVKYGERENTEGYTVIDLNVVWKQKRWALNVMFNNLLDTRYTETNLVPMPGAHALAGIQYRF